MIITDKKSGLCVYPNFDSGSYMGSWRIQHNELNYIDSSDPKFDVCSMLISTYVGKYLDGTLGEITDDNEFIPEQKGYQTDEDAVRFINNEGLEYAVTNYINADQFSNEKTRKLWYKAQVAIRELEKHLKL